jgi:hypothetical protein
MKTASAVPPSRQTLLTRARIPPAAPVPATQRPKIPAPDPYTVSHKPALDFRAVKVRLYFSTHDPAKVAGQ